jgi:hypothetical protein
MMPIVVCTVHSSIASGAPFCNVLRTDGSASKVSPTKGGGDSYEF